jgi:hypothetical protein
MLLLKLYNIFSLIVLLANFFVQTLLVNLSFEAISKLLKIK